MTSKRAVLAIVGIALTASACSQKMAPKSAYAMPAPGAPSEIGRFSANDAETVPTQAEFRQATGSDRVLFATDSADLDEKDKETLQRQVDWLVNHPKLKITLEGHCDERGTRDYNLALGEKRANAVKNFIGSMGIDTSRMTVISYGKERPEALGSNEEAWAQNRRAVTIILH